MTATAPTGSRRLRVLAPLVLLALAIVQVSLVDFLPTPWAAPDLVTVAVLALAVAHGPVVGCLAGAGAGLALDLIPPAAGPLGGWMLVLTIAAAAVGQLADTQRPGPVAAMAAVAIGCGVVVLGRAAVVWFAGAPAELASVPQALAAAAWALLIAPLALIITTPRRRATPRPGPRRVVPGSPAAGSGGSRP